MAGMVARVPALVAVRRVITRPPGAGGEVFEPEDDAGFERRRAQGDFVLHWQAHGLRYGIPAGTTALTAQGRDVLANLSRSVLAEAHRRFPRLTVLSLTADPEVLETRLHARRRETPAQIGSRLARADVALPPGIDVVSIDNSGLLEDTVTRALAALYPVRA
ncbi:hypothetical protein BOO69_14640 [Sulfitobacter alexandrii]|uniref:Ribose 1,5-bisphosphate phosphokinase PhnN n=2 Tax=Sulfitobacter alexandrii TaxID=1917485 RepID=A0A1J0WM92_9RHOB|nr:hypothetical protein BOO69_14640 [Sulfitobacter alexandrii]